MKHICCSRVLCDRLTWIGGAYSLYHSKGLCEDEMLGFDAPVSDDAPIF